MGIQPVDFAWVVEPGWGNLMGSAELIGTLSYSSVAQAYGEARDYFLNTDPNTILDPWQMGNSFQPSVAADNLIRFITGRGFGMTAETATMDYALIYNYVRSRSFVASPDANLNEIQGAINNYVSNGSPIAIDLNGDGIHTMNISNSQVYFDLLGDGSRVRTAWLSGDDGFLAVDTNNNGVIDSVNEMFGGLNRGDGFAKLSAYDSNHDGVVNSLDEKFNSFVIWQDKNQNGKTDEGELRTLAEAGLSELSLNYRSSDLRDEGNLFGEVSSAVLNGQQVEMTDVYFQYYRVGPESAAGSSIGDAGLPSVDQKISALISSMAAFDIAPSVDSTSLVINTQKDSLVTMLA